MKKIFFLLLLLPCIVVQAQYVEVSGTVKKFTDNELVFREYTPNPIRLDFNARNTFRTTLDTTNGHYRIKIPINYINSWIVKNGEGFVIFDLVPDSKVVVDIDSFNIVDGYRASGTNANDVNFSAYLYQDTFYYNASRTESYKDEIKNHQFATILEKRKAIERYGLGILDKYNKTHPMSDAYYTWKKTQFVYSPYERLIIDYIGASGFQRSSTLDSADYAPLFSIPFNDDYAAGNSYEYNELVDSYITMLLCNWHFRPYSIDSIYDLGKAILHGKTRDAFLSYCLYSIRNTRRYDSLYNDYIQTVKTPYFTDIVTKGRQEYLESQKAAADTKDNILDAPNLKEIFAKYKGKVVYVDFWASWCGPCRSEMEFVEPIKKKYQGKDVVFLYLAYQDKKVDWLQAIKDLNIKGEHFLLSPTLVKDANRIFNIQGIPHYALVDKEGNIVDKAAPRPSGGEQLTEAIDKLL